MKTNTHVPVELFLLQLHICHSDELIELTLCLYDLCLSGGISPTLLLMLVEPPYKNKQDLNLTKCLTDSLLLQNC